MTRFTGLLCCVLFAVCSFFLSCGSAPPADVAIVTYHYDSLRTGWNDKEATLTPTNVQATTNCAAQKCFGLLYPPTALDEQVDAQPLVVPHGKIKHCGSAPFHGCPPGDYDVVYVATENNSIYAVSSLTGNALFQQTLGPAMPSFSKPWDRQYQSRAFLVGLTAGGAHVITTAATSA